MMSLILVAVLSSGCASLSPPLASDTSNHQVQSAQRAKAEKPLKPLPEMTAADYEALGDRHYQQGNLPLAFMQYDKALRLSPGDPRIEYKRSYLFLQNGAVDQAIAAFQQILDTDANFAPAHEGLGESFLQAGKLKQAEQSCRKAIDLDSTRWRSYNCLGMAYDRQKRHQDAAAAYQDAIALQPQRSILLNNLGLSYLAQENYEAATRVLKKALTLEKGNIKIYNNLGIALSRWGKYEEALDTFSQGGNPAQAHNNLGVMYMAEGQYQKAIASFEKAISLHPSYYETASRNLTLAMRGLADPPMQSPTEAPRFDRR